MEIFGVINVPTDKLPEWQLTTKHSVYCFDTQAHANAFMLWQLGLAYDRHMFSWVVPGTENDDKPRGIGMACVRYKLDVPAELVEERKNEWESQKCPEGYLGKVRVNDMYKPQVSAYFLGRDTTSRVKSYPANEVNIAELVQARKDKCTQEYEELMKNRAQSAERRAARLAARKAANAEKSAAKKAVKMQEQRAWEGSAGMRLIQQYIKTLNETESYSVFARNLVASFKKHAAQSHDDASKMHAANEALKDVYGQVQTFAARNGDFEMATFAKNVVDTAMGYLIEDERDAREAYQERQPTGMSREEVSALGIYIPDERY